MPELFTRESSGRYRPATAIDVFVAARVAVDTVYARGATMTAPHAVREYLSAKLQGEEREIFACLYLDTKHRLIAYDELSQGTIDSAHVHAREVVKSALRHNAAAVILAHNHPSGDTEPSHADRALTTRLKDALALIDIRILDHLIIGVGAYSFAEHGDL